MKLHTHPRLALLTLFTAILSSPLFANAQLLPTGFVAKDADIDGQKLH